MRYYRVQLLHGDLQACVRSELPEAAGGQSLPSDDDAAADEDVLGGGLRALAKRVAEQPPGAAIAMMQG